MKKALSFLLTFVFIFSAVSVFADEITYEKLDVYINDASPASWVCAVETNDTIYLPAIASSRLFDIDVNVIDYYSSAATILSQNGNWGYFFNDNCYAIINSIALDMPYPTITVNGILYIPCEIFTSLFDIDCSTKLSDGIKSLNLSKKTVPEKDEQVLKLENDINSRKIESSTDYLIWVSKKDYSVRLFTKNNSSWQLEKEFPCAIGKPSSPTCEGTFKYYEKVTAWKYDKYYVGPVMRFNGGYALHSTLVKYDKTPYDDRVGVKISAGCVRLHPDDIQYLWDTVPLQTTVYITP